jgi:hypothetical protein
MTIPATGRSLPRTERPHGLPSRKLKVPGDPPGPCADIRERFAVAVSGGRGQSPGRAAEVVQVVGGVSVMTMAWRPATMSKFATRLTRVNPARQSRDVSCDPRCDGDPSPGIDLGSPVLQENQELMQVISY